MFYLKSHYIFMLIIQISKDADPFAIHNPAYRKVCTAMTETLQKEDLSIIKDKVVLC